MKTAILITGRLKSTRLPMKAVREICGRQMIRHLIDRLKSARRVDEIVLCTSPVEQDDPLAVIAEEEGIGCFRGDPVDVLQRLTDAARQIGADTVVNALADNPFTDPEYIDRLIDYHIAHQHDYSKTSGLPWGAFAYALSYPAMVKVCQLKADQDTEIWGAYFTETGLFRWGVMDVTDPEARWPDLRLTVDTPEDFEVATKIFETLYRPGQIFSIRDVIALCRQRPELTMANRNVQQRAAPPIHLKDKPA